MKQPLITCTRCHGKGSRALSKRLLWCYELLLKHQPCTVPELWEKTDQTLDVTYFNHMMGRLVKGGLVVYKDVPVEGTKRIDKVYSIKPLPT